VLGPDVVSGGPDFPARLKAARLRLGLTLEALADRSGVDPRTLRFWEAGAYTPLRRTLAKVEAIVGGLGPQPRDGQNPKNGA
jgi:transcriptional regulator with XRE-family HTH domain